MDLLPIQRHVDASDLPLERVAGSTQLTEAQKVGEATRQFEALLLRQILAEAQKPLLYSEDADNSTASTIYRDLITERLADSISRSGTLGLARSLEGELARQLRAATEEETPDARSEVNPTPPALKAEVSSARAAAAFVHHERTATEPH